MQLVVRLLPSQAKFSLLQPYFEVHFDYFSYCWLFSWISSGVYLYQEGTSITFFSNLRLMHLVVGLLPSHAKFALLQPNFEVHLD